MFGQCNRNLRVVLLYGVYDIPAKNMVSGFVAFILVKYLKLIKVSAVQKHVHVHKCS